jgi:hypothetical protein
MDRDGCLRCPASLVPPVLDAGADGCGFRQMFARHICGSGFVVAVAVTLAIYRLEADDLLMRFGRDDWVNLIKSN